MMPRGATAGALICAVVAAVPAAPTTAGSTSFCVTCIEPDRTYVCRVETPENDPGPGALQYYCIFRAAKEEGHKSCAVSKQADGRCVGIEKTYTYNGPALPAQLQATIDKQAADSVLPPAPATPPAQAKSGPPETLVEMTARARERLRGADTAEGAQQNAEGVIQESSEAAREGGSRVGNAARSVGRAARTAFGCVWSLFRDCRSESTN